MQQYPSPKILEELKAAGEELKRAEAKPRSERNLYYGAKVQTKAEVNPVRDSEDRDKSKRQHISNGVKPQPKPEIQPKPEPEDTKPRSESESALLRDKKAWILPEVYQKTILQEKQKLQEAQKRMQDLQKSIQERLDKVEEIEAQTKRLNKELKELDQEIVLIKKENNTILYQINEQRIKNFKNNLEK